MMSTRLYQYSGAEVSEVESSVQKATLFVVSLDSRMFENWGSNGDSPIMAAIKACYVYCRSQITSARRDKAGVLFLDTRGTDKRNRVSELPGMSFVRPVGYMMLEELQRVMGTIAFGGFQEKYGLSLNSASDFLKLSSLLFGSRLSGREIIFFSGQDNPHQANFSELDACALNELKEATGRQMRLVVFRDDVDFDEPFLRNIKVTKVTYPEDLMRIMRQISIGPQPSSLRALPESAPSGPLLITDEPDQVTEGHDRQGSVGDGSEPVVLLERIDVAAVLNRERPEAECRGYGKSYASTKPSKRRTCTPSDSENDSSRQSTEESDNYSSNFGKCKRPRPTRNNFNISIDDSSSESSIPCSKESSKESSDNARKNITYRRRYLYQSARGPLGLLDLSNTSTSGPDSDDSEVDQMLHTQKSPIRETLRTSTTGPRQGSSRPAGFALPTPIPPARKAEDVILTQNSEIARLEATVKRGAAKIAVLEEDIVNLKNPSDSFDNKLRSIFLREKMNEVGQKELKLRQKNFAFQSNQLAQRGNAHQSKWKTSTFYTFRCTFEPALWNIELVDRVLKERFSSATGRDFVNHRIRLYLLPKSIMEMEISNGMRGARTINFPQLGNLWLKNRSRYF